MYWLSMSVTDGMMGYLQSAATPALAWKNLLKLNEENTKVRKLQLKTEFNTVKRGSLCINDYALKIKGIVESLGSIGVTVDDDDVVGAMLEGLGDAYSNFKSSMNTRNDICGLTELTSMLIREEKNLGLAPSSSQNRNNSNQQAFYSSRGRGRGRGTGAGVGRGQNQDMQHNQGHGRGRGQQTSQGRGDMEIRIQVLTGNRIQILM